MRDQVEPGERGSPAPGPGGAAGRTLGLLTAPGSAPAGGALRLRPLRLADEAAFRAGHEAMRPDGFTFGLDDFDADTSWPEYLQRVAAGARGVQVQPGRVPATFLVADVGGQLVGRTSIRHTLNDWLRREGGHIGYGVLPAHRRRGYATEILRQSLVVARSLGVARSLLICAEANLASRAVIERCGGVLEGLALAEDGRPIRRYWVD